MPRLFYMTLLVGLLPASPVRGQALFVPQEGGIPTACDPEGAARAFLAREGQGAPGVGYGLRKRTSYGAVQYFDFQQRFDGVPVFGAGYTVAVRPDCTLEAARGAVVVDVPTAPRLDPQAARRVAATVFELGADRAGLSLLIVPRPGPDLLAYRVTMNGVVVLVDAHTGFIEANGVQSSSYGMGAHRDITLTPSRGPDRRAEPATREGVGYAYPIDPGIGTHEVLTLPRLFEGPGRLDGVYVRASSIRLQQDGSPVLSLDGAGDYRYEPVTENENQCLFDLTLCSNFDAVNLYYHIDRFAHEYWRESLGVDIDFQVHAVAHVAGDAAFADAREGIMKFGLGDIFLKNTAKEDELIYHEYTHALLHHLGFVLDIFSPRETFALGEGYADYFSATYTDDPRLGEWAVNCPPRLECPGPPNDDEYRILNTDPAVWNWRYRHPSDTLQYGLCTRFHEGDGKCKTSYGNYADQYVWGMIWGGALWDLRTAVGADAADRLVLQGLLLAHSGDLTFEEAVDGLYRADALSFSGRYADTLAAVFSRRGIARATGTAVAEPAEPPDAVIALHPGYPNPFGATTTLPFYLSEPGPATLVVYDALGRAVARLADGWHTAGLHRVTWTAAGMAAGVYLAKLSTPNASHTRRLVLQR